MEINYKQINETLKNDGVIAFVTDTVWGLGCLPSSEKAVKKIYEIKHREAKKPLILMSYDIYPLFDYSIHHIHSQHNYLCYRMCIIFIILVFYYILFDILL